MSQCGADWNASDRYMIVSFTKCDAMNISPGFSLNPHSDTDGYVWVMKSFRSVVQLLWSQSQQRSTLSLIDQELKTCWVSRLSFHPLDVMLSFFFCLSVCLSVASPSLFLSVYVDMWWLARVQVFSNRHKSLHLSGIQTITSD